MSVKRKAKVVMLPTKKADNALKGYIDGSLLFKYQKEYKTIEAEKGFTGYYHLYLLSDDEIQENDWCYDAETFSIEIVKSSLLNLIKHTGIKFRKEKIIATTNSSLKIIIDYNYGRGILRETVRLPQPSQSFIQKFIDAYNSGNPITDVMVEYEEYFHSPSPIGMSVDERLKVNPKDNTITITKVKDSWSREEVIVILLKLFRERVKFPSHNSEEMEEYYNKWIKQNL